MNRINIQTILQVYLNPFYVSPSMLRAFKLCEKFNKFAPKPVAEDAIDDKVDGAVEGDKEIACLA